MNVMINPSFQPPTKMLYYLCFLLLEHICSFTRVTIMENDIYVYTGSDLVACTMDYRT